jgi:hypothetical protein
MSVDCTLCIFGAIFKNIFLLYKDRMIQKRGISSVVQVILLVAIAIISVAVLWVILAPMIETQIDVGSSCFDAKNNLRIEPQNTYLLSEENLSFQFSRGKENFDLKGIHLELESDSESYSADIYFENEIRMGGRKTYQINKEKFEGLEKFSPNMKLSMSPIINVGQKSNNCGICSTAIIDYPIDGAVYNDESEDEEEDSSDEESSSEDSQTDSSLIQIATWEDLYNVRNNLKGSYILVADLDSSSVGYDSYASSSANGGKGWTPIGGEIVCDENALPSTKDYFSSCTGIFKGSFDGNGKSISNLFINNSEFDLDSDPQFSNSLFDWIGPEGKIKNLNLLDVLIISNGKRNSAGLFYTAYHATLENVHVTGNITSLGGYAGGIGTVLGVSSKIDNSSFEGNVEGNSSVGGLFGGGGIGNVILNSYASANVKGKTSVGGLLGNTGYGVLVNSSYSSGNVEGEQNVGGLIGYSVYGVKMNDCYSNSDIEGNSGVGGLIGNGHIHQITIKNSYSSGKIEGSSYVGGFFGGDKSYSTATNPQSTNNFFDKGSSGQSKGASNFIGKTTSEMKTLSTFSTKNWNIKAVADVNSRDTSSKWNMVEGNSYPFLSWQ